MSRVPAHRAPSLPAPSLPAPSRRSALRCLGATLACAAVMGAVGCGAKLQAERAQGYPLEERTRYAWVTEEPVLIQIGEPQPKVRTAANEKNLRAAIDRELGTRGFSLVAKDEAELLVAFSVGTAMRYRLEGGGPGTLVGGIQPGAQQTKGTLNIYLFDRATTQEVWHGWTSKWLSKVEDPVALADEAVATVMTMYPNEK